MNALKHVAVIVVVGICILAAPFFFYPILLMKLLCFALFAAAFNLLVGYTGLMSFGHAAFFGAGAYASGVFIKSWGLSPELAVLLATAVAGATGLIMGSLAIRRQGIYFSMVTLALSQMIYFIFLQSKFTGGEDGLQGVPRGVLFGFLPLKDDRVLYYVVAVVVIAALLLIWRTVHSPFGRVLASLRDNERRALSLGYDVDRFKLLAFVLSAAFAGLAGALKTIVFGFATLVDSQWQTSGEVILMTLLGGLGTMLGPLLGSSIVVLLQSELADKVGSKVTIIMGLLFITCVLSFRRGIVGELERYLYLRRGRAALHAINLHGRGVAESVGKMP